MLGFVVFFFFEVPGSSPRKRRDGFPRGLDNDRCRRVAARPRAGRRARLAQPLLDQAPDELAQGGAAQRGTGLERPAQLVWEINGRAHLLMRIRIAVKASVGSMVVSP